MFLREYLTKYTKEELLDQARSFEIKKCSGLRKADLIDRIVDTFCADGTTAYVQHRSVK